MGQIATVTAQLAGMRKPQAFVVYPPNTLDANRIKIQSDRAIGVFDAETGVGLLNWRGSGAKYSHHLARINGAEPCVFPREFIDACLAAQPKRGDVIAGVLVIA